MSSPPEPTLFLKPGWLSTESYGLVLLLVSAVLFSGMGVFVRLSADTGIPPMQLVFMRALFQGSIVVVCMLHCRAETEAHGVIDQRILMSPFGGTRRVRNLLIARGAIGGTGFVLVYYTITALPLGDAMALISLYPIATVFVASIVLKEPISLLNVIVAFASVAGAVLISSPSFLNNGTDTGDVNPVGYATGILAAFFASGVITLIRKAGMVGAHTLQLLFSWAAFGLVLSALFGMIMAYAEENERWRLPPSFTSWIFVFAMCSVGSAAHFLLNYAGRLAPAALGSIMRSSDIMWAYLWQVIVFHKQPSNMTYIGVALIVLSLISVGVQKVRDEKNKMTKGMKKIPTMDVEEEDSIEMGNQRKDGSDEEEDLSHIDVTLIEDAE